MSNLYKTQDSKFKSKLSKDPTDIIGFINNWGESNCFLNSALQVLYHQIPFRSALKSYQTCPSSKSHYCLSCGLKEIFSTYSSRASQSNLFPIDITKFRSELASKYESENLFAINEPGDSMEALNAILSSFHSDPERKCSNDCPAHSIFRLHIEESMICKCGASKTDVWDMNTFSQPFYVNDIFEEIQGVDQYQILRINERDFEELMSVSNVIKFENRLQDYIRNQWASSIFDVCPQDCKLAKSHKELRLHKAPKVFAVNLIWRDFNPRLNKILQVLASISYSISLDSVYNYKSHALYALKAVILYGRGHYICAIRLGPNKLWYKIDDERDRQVGKGSWLDFVHDCLSNRYYPVGLFYGESPEREETGIAPKNWITLERKLLEFLKNMEETEEDKEWICACGKSNNAHWTFCTVCKKLKPGVSGWICKTCTFLNNTEHIHCRSCGEKKTKDCIASCSCKKKPCVCPKKCDHCGSVFIDKCKECFTGNFCFICSVELNKNQSKVCYFCKGETDGRRCVLCRVELDKRVCEKCIKILKKCYKCQKYSEEDAIRCTYAKCKNPFSMYNTFNARNREVTNDTHEEVTVVREWNCEQCKENKKNTEKKYCIDCFDRNQKCKECKGSKNYCENCFKSLKMCELCKELFRSDAKCMNKECMSNHVESSPKRIEEAVRPRITNCLMCEKKLPDYGFCLNCKLKIRADRCTLCDCERSNEFCENCVQYTRICASCKKPVHLTSKRCTSC